MLYYDYHKISEAIKELNDMVNNAFVGEPRVTTNVGKDFGAPKSFVGGKKEVVDCFSHEQKIFLEKIMQQCIDSHNKEVSKDIHELYDRLGALSSNMNNINEKIAKLKEDNLRNEGIVIEYNLKIAKHILETENRTLDQSIKLKDANDKIENIIKTWIGTQNTVNNLDASIEELSKKLDRFISVATEYRCRILGLEKIHQSR